MMISSPRCFISYFFCVGPLFDYWWLKPNCAQITNLPIITFHNRWIGFDFRPQTSPFSLSRSSFEVEMSWNVLLPASPHILILARKQSAAIKLWPKLRRSSLLGNQFSILSIYLAPLPNLWLLPSFFSDSSQLSPQIAKPFSRADHSAKGSF